MTARQGAWRIAFLLVLLGVATVGLRYRWRQQSPLAHGDTAWRLTYAVDFHAERAGARLRAAFPMDTSHSRVVRYELLHSGMNTERFRPSTFGTREVVAVAPRSGQFHVEGRFDIHLTARPNGRGVAVPTNLTAEARAECLREEKEIQVSSPAVAAVVKRILDERVSKTVLAERLFEYCLSGIHPGGDGAPQDAAAAIQQGVASSLGRTRAMVALCRACKIPTRLACGVMIESGAEVQPQYWAEVLVDNAWKPYDPDAGYAQQLPDNLVPIRRDGQAIIRATGVSELTTRLSVVPSPAVGPYAVKTGRLTDIFDLTRLPVPMHEVLAVILLLPLGALVTALFRTIVGLRTFGTFTPTLLALAFVYNNWWTGLMIFASVLVLGLMSRTMLDRLKLLLVPRLGIILTLVVLCMVFAISILDYFERTPSSQAVLLPMVILTMTVERFYVTTEEDSLRFAVQLLAGTLALGFCIYLLLCWDAVGHMILTYPELHCFTVAVLILIGRYTGYRLTELWRFHDVGEIEK